jgi:hypothetical protein
MTLFCYAVVCYRVYTSRYRIVEGLHTRYCILAPLHITTYSILARMLSVNHGTRSTARGCLSLFISCFVQIRKMFEPKGRALLSSKEFFKKKDFEVQ